MFVRVVHVCVYAGAHGLRIELISEIVLLKIRLKLCANVRSQRHEYFGIICMFCLCWDLIFDYYVMYSCSAAMHHSSSRSN